MNSLPKIAHDFRSRCNADEGIRVIREFWKYVWQQSASIVLIRCAGRTVSCKICYHICKNLGNAFVCLIHLIAVVYFFAGNCVSIEDKT